MMGGAKLRANLRPGPLKREELARLALVQGVVTVLASGLATLGVDAPEEMR